MEIWIKQGKEELRLPILPKQYELQFSRNNTEVNLSNYGGVNLIGRKKLATLALESFFPNQEYPFVQYKGFPKPRQCVHMIKQWVPNPVTVIITDAGIKMQMTIETFSHREQDGTGDIYYSIELKEYRIPKVETVKVKPSKTTKKVVKPSTSRPAKKVTSKTYTVKSGDSLSKIAQKQTGKASNWQAIYNQNKSVIGGNPHRIYPGQKLVIKV